MGDVPENQPVPPPTPENHVTPRDEGGVLQTPPTPRSSTPGIIDRPLGERAVLPAPSETTMPEEDQGEQMESEAEECGEQTVLVLGECVIEQEGEITQTG